MSASVETVKEKNKEKKIYLKDTFWLEEIGETETLHRDGMSSLCVSSAELCMNFFL